MLRSPFLRQGCAIAVAIWSLVAIGLPHEKEGHREPFFEGAAHGDEPAHLESARERPGRPCTACLIQSRNLGDDSVAFCDLPPRDLEGKKLVERAFLSHRRFRSASPGRAPPLS